MFTARKICQCSFRNLTVFLRHTLKIENPSFKFKCVEIILSYVTHSRPYYLDNSKYYLFIKRKHLWEKEERNAVMRLC